MANELKFEKCWKVVCTPPIEVYKSYINFFGTNIDICDIDKLINKHEERALWAKQAKKVWNKEFNNKE